MAHWYHLTRQSSNAKTGKIAVSTTSKDSCPDGCKLKTNGSCYAMSGPLRLHWDQVSLGPHADKPRGLDLLEFCNSIRSLPEGSLMRHNQAGDLPVHPNGSINYHALKLITAAITDRKITAWTYTHHDVENLENSAAVIKTTKAGLTVNLSCHNQQYAAAKYRKGFAVTCIVPKDTQVNSWCTDGVKFVICPAQTKANKTCAECRLCADANRTCIIAFKAHGTQARKVESTIA